jgi:DNA-binding CsgD family transcriptional regulator
MMEAFPNTAEFSIGDAIRKLGKPGFEAALGQALHRIAAPDNVIVLAYRNAGPPQILYRQSVDGHVFANLETTYLSGAYLLDPFFDLHLQMVPRGAYRLRDVAPDAFLRSRYFVEYYDQTTLIDEITFVAYPRDGVSLSLCIGRDGSSGQTYAPRVIEACHRAAPIICALAEAHWAALVGQIGRAEDVGQVLAAAAEAAHGIRLSPRQAEVALLILRGHSSVSIGLRLGVAHQTVKVFRKQLYARCDISSQAELFALMVPLLKALG